MKHSTALRFAASMVACTLVVAACSSDDNNSSGSSTTPTTSGDTAPDREIGLVLGVMAPGPGLLVQPGIAIARGIDLAIDDINKGGGALGKNVGTVTVAETQDGDMPTTFADMLAKGGNAMIGPVGSNSAASLMPLLEDADAMACSASATVPTLTTADIAGTFFRTALPDQNTVTFVADTIVKEQQPPSAITVVHRDDDYGTSVGNGLANTLLAKGYAVTVVPYNANQVTLTDVGTAVAATKPALTVMVSLDESPLLLSALVGASVDPKAIIGLDGTFTPRLAEIAFGADASKADGLRVIGTTGNRDFFDRLLAQDPEAPILFSAQAYDCAVIMALAAETAKSTTATDIATNIVAVTGSGVACSTYADCLAKIQAGEDIDYNGVSGPINMDANGDPTAARFTIARFSNGQLSDAQTTDVDLIAQSDALAAQAAIASAVFTTTLQQALRVLGFYDGPIDGIMDEDVVAALGAFQQAQGLPVTGEYDPATAEALTNLATSVSSALTTSTTQLQLTLTQLGYYSGPIDGQYSAAVVAAVRALQTTLGVPTTGILDAATVRAAYEKGIVVGSASVPTTTTPPPTTPPPTAAPPVTDAPVAPTTPPEASTTIVDMLAADPRFSTLSAVLAASSVDLTAAGPFTLFAPTNDAFVKLGITTPPTDPAVITKFIQDHVVNGLHPSSSLTDGQELTTLDPAKKLTITVDGATIHVNGTALVIPPDITASNGVILPIDTALVTIAAS